MRAQVASPTFTHVYAALVAILNTKVCLTYCWILLACCDYRLCMTAGSAFRDMFVSYEACVLSHWQKVVLLSCLPLDWLSEWINLIMVEQVSGSGAGFSKVLKSFCTQKAIANSQTLRVQSCSIHILSIWTEVRSGKKFQAYTPWFSSTDNSIFASLKSF